MAQVDGIDVLIIEDTTTFTCATDISIEYEQDVESPPPCKGGAAAAWETPARGAKRGSGSISGIVDDAATYGYENLQDALSAGTNLTLHFTTNVASDIRDTVTAILTRVGQQSSSTGKQTYDADFVITGAPTFDTV